MHLQNNSRSNSQSSINTKNQSIRLENAGSVEQTIESTFAQRNLTPVRYIQQLLMLSDISSSTFDFSGVLEIQNHIEKFLKNLNFKVKYYQHPEGLYAPTLVGYYNAHSSKTLTLAVQADTNLENIKEYKVMFSENKKHIIGPGVASHKAGITVALQSLQEFFSETDPDFNIQFISSSCEEVGSHGFEELFESLGKKSNFVFSFESSPSEVTSPYSAMNYMGFEENICLRGLGPTGGKLKTEDEFVVINSIGSRVRVIVNTLHKLKEIEVT